MKIKTSNLIDSALDYAVCIAGKSKFIHWPNFQPSIDWSQGGPIIESEEIILDGVSSDGKERGYRSWSAYMCDEWGDYYGIGPTPLIAAMRCYVASKLGYEVEVPEELL